MAMLRWSGFHSFMRLPAIRTSPALARSSPATIRRVVVLPQPEGPRRQTTSPAETERLKSWTAVNAPKCLLTRLSSIVDTGLSLDGSERDPAQELILKHEGDDD